MSESLTTLQLAHWISLAVLAAAPGPRGEEDLMRDPPTQAVLRTLHDTGHWFCRMGETADGETRDTVLEPVQRDLFT